jgi:hypothetical protein
MLTGSSSSSSSSRGDDLCICWQNRGDDLWTGLTLFISIRINKQQEPLPQHHHVYITVIVIINILPVITLVRFLSQPLQPYKSQLLRQHTNQMDTQLPAIDLYRICAKRTKDHVTTTDFYIL